MKTSARGHAQEVKSAATTERPEPGASAGATAGAARRRGPRRLLGNASSAIWVATAVLFLVSWIVQPQSVGHSSLLGMLPFAAVLAIAAMGQTLIIQQGGIDLSVPGMISITVVIMTRIPDGDSSKVIPAILLAFAVTMAAGLLAGLLVSRVGVTSIVTTLGMNALLYGGVLQISGGSPRPTTDALHNFATGTAILGIPNSVIVAIVLTAIVGFIVKQTVLGRRFEAVGASSAGSRAAGLAPARHQTGAYVGAAVMYCAAGILLAGIVKTPSAFQGDSYLLPSVAAVVLGGTSLLGGRGSVVASAVAALFLSQLDQLVLTTGVNSAIQNLVQAAALAVGVAVYSVPWARVREWASARRGQQPAGAGGSSG